MADIRTIALPDGETIPRLESAPGTWATTAKTRADEIAALQMAVDLGMTVVDTAEMYGDGAAEELVAEALGDRRGRDLPRQQGAAAARDQARHDCRVRGEPRPVEDRPARPVSAALARQRAARRDARGVRHARARRQDSPLGRQQLRRRRHGRARGARRRGRHAGRDQSGALQPDAPRHRIRPAAVVPHARHSGDGVLAARAGAAHRAQGASTPSPLALARRPRKWRWPGCCGSLA